MSENKHAWPVAETQKQRWLKYGGNVALASALVVALAVVLTWLGQRPNLSLRLDTTAGRLYSLKPQTINIIKNNDQEITLVSLYTRNRPVAPALGDEGNSEFDFRTPVNDLLEEFRRKGRNIQVRLIDPIEEAGKVQDLIQDVIKRYSADIGRYSEALGKFADLQADLSTLAREESERLKQTGYAALPRQQAQVAEAFDRIASALGSIPRGLDRIREQVDQRLAEKIPDYEDAVRIIQDLLGQIARNADAMIEFFDDVKDEADLPQPLREYAGGAVERVRRLKTLADEFTARLKELGELKLDDIKRSLQQTDAILVLGPREHRVISRDKVWLTEDIRSFSADGRVRPRFAGEQQVTSAILSLTSYTRPRAVFVRAGGQPLTEPGFPPFVPGGPMAIVGERLREYNFEVMEKDLSGSWAMQSRMQGMSSATEPSDEEMKNAVWVVLDAPMRQQMGPSPAIAQRLAEHLKAGGSALVLSGPSGNGLAEALDDWGITIRPDVIAVHEPVASTAPPSADFIEQAQRIPHIFVLNEWGDHPLARPLRSLEGLLLPIVLVQTQPREQVRSWPLAPVPQTLPVWGETDIRSLEQRPPRPTFDPAVDVPPPLFGGAAAEHEGGGRVVVIGSYQFAFDELLMIADEAMLRQRVFVRRFPANLELFMNSMFWLARMDTMIDISPAAMDVSRVRQISPAALNFWRIGVILVALPLGVIATGVVVYMRRRD